LGGPGSRAGTSGYQAQNTLISSTLIGIDRSEMVPGPALSGAITEPSGPIDVDGQPFMITSRGPLRPPVPWSTGGYYYIKVATGSAWNKKSLVTVASTTPPTYDPIRRGLYFVNSNGTRERCLNWIVYNDGRNSGLATPFRIAMGRPQFHIENFLDIDGLDTKWSFQFTAGDVALGRPASASLESLTHGRSSVLLINKPLAAGGTFKVSFTATASGVNSYNYTIEELPHGSSSRIVKGRRNVRNTPSPDNFVDTYSFSPYSRIHLYADLSYRGIARWGKHMRISNFKVGVSQEISPLMRHLLNLNDF